jgi:hypothetical protein
MNVPLARRSARQELVIAATIRLNRSSTQNSKGALTMKRTTFTALCLASCWLACAALADETSEDLSGAIKAVAAQAPGAPAPKFPEWSKVIGQAKQKEGLFPLYHNEKDQQLFMEIKRHQFEQEFLLPIAIARGNGLMYLGGDTLNFGDQWVVSFRRAADRILVVRKDVRHKADQGSPQASAVALSYNDSIIASLNIRSEKDNGESVLVDLSDLFMTDLAGIGIYPDRSRSTWGKVKGFPQNVEIELNAVFSSPYYYFFFGRGAGGAPDPRGTQVVIHYSLCAMTEQGYRPRVADDRVGHFLSTVRDFSKDVEESPSVRYVTRWNLEKSNPSADRSPPKQPIIFWIEKTVPREYRPYVREGILEWNKAFDKLGFIEAIQVRDQQTGDDFDPEDLRYNTFRWISTSAGFAMGPSRANPRTGQILDADIVFDEGMIRYWRQEYLLRAGLPQGMSLLLEGHDRAFHRMHAAELPELQVLLPEIGRRMDELKNQLSPTEFAAMKNNVNSQPLWQRENSMCECCQMGRGMQQQLGLAASVLLAKGDLPPGSKVPETLIAQAIKEVVMHEVGHTLGLRHNFKASTMLSLADCNNTTVTHEKGMAGSVMDYLPANIARKGDKQGDYFSTTIGPYDYWAIEYAYKPVSGSEKEELAKIAAKAPHADLTYGTDEDMFMNPDPRINAFDLGDPMDYAENRIELVKASLEGLDERTVADGEGWQRARHAFSLLMSELYRSSYLALGYIGGQYTARDHRGDAEGRPPMQLIPVEKQRKGLKLVADEILEGRVFNFSPRLLQRLAPEHQFDDLSFFFFFNRDYHYPVLNQILGIQRLALNHCFSPTTLRTVQELELHASEGTETLKLAEIFSTISNAVWKELPQEGEVKEVKLTVMRRNLQREHVQRLARMVLGPKPPTFMGFYYNISSSFDGGSGAVPPDARSLARADLQQISKRIQGALGDTAAETDAATAAHLKEIVDRIESVLAARLEVNAP